MSRYPNLSELKPLIEKCVMCGGCHADCPTYALSRREHDSARGKMLLADALLKGDINGDNAISKKFDHCLTCMSCVETCPAGANPVKVIMAARSDIRGMKGNKVSGFIFGKLLTSRKGTGLFSKLLALATKLYKLMPAISGLPFVGRGKKRKFPEFRFNRLKDSYPETIKSALKSPIRVAYFAGCMTDSVFQESGRSVIEIMSAGGAEVTLLKEEVCCGAPAYFSGDFNGASISAKKNVELLEKGDFDFIITSCATCGSVLKDVYPTLLGEKADNFSGKITDFQEFLRKNIWDSVPLKELERPLKVTYHEPCHLSRGMNVRKEPREILKNLPGVKYVEMSEASRCCGGAGSFGMKYYSDSLDIGRVKAESIKRTGADIVVTACPSCEMQLIELLSRYAPEVEVMHTAQLIRKLLKG